MHGSGNEWKEHLSLGHGAHLTASHAGDLDQACDLRFAEGSPELLTVLCAGVKTIKDAMI
jgi:hypothetical protein